MFDVVAVEADFFFEVEIAAAADLAEARDARLYGEQKMVVAFVIVHFLGEVRAGADEAHVAFEHVPKIGELIEAGFAEPTAKACDAGIVLDFHQRSFAVILFGEQGSKATSNQYRLSVWPLFSEWANKLNNIIAPAKIMGKSLFRIQAINGAE